MKNNHRASASITNDTEIYEFKLVISEMGYWLEGEGKEHHFVEVNKLCSFLRGMQQASLPTIRQEKLCRERPPPPVPVTIGPQPKRRGGQSAEELAVFKSLSLEELGL